MTSIPSARRLRHLGDLLGRRNLPGQQQIKQPLGERLLSASGSWKFFADFGNRVTAKPDAFLCVDGRGLGDQAFHTAHSAIGLGDGYLSEDVVTVFGQDRFYAISHRWDLLGKPTL